MRRILPGWLALMVVLVAVPLRAETIRGMTISCLGAGRAWGSDDMARTLDVLQDLGVNWVAIHPYGGIRNDGTVGRSGIDRLYDDPSWLTRAIREAHARDMRILIKPHLAYWGTRFSWRGEIRFEDAAAWERFFGTYEEWITKVARLSKECDSFVVGTELDQTTAHDERWRAIIAAVRAEVDVPLTYSAGWDTFRSVPFWDALDAIGIQSYFPLVEHEGPPTDEELALAWTALVAELEGFGAEHERPVVLAELGYNRSLAAAVRPWSYRMDADATAEDIQLRCLGTALSALEGSEGIVGAFLWKWFPGDYQRGNFRKSDPAVREVIAHHWAAPAAR
jgi:hypothetical protein